MRNSIKFLLAFAATGCGVSSTSLTTLNGTDSIEGEGPIGTLSCSEDKSQEDNVPTVVGTSFVRITARAVNATQLRNVSLGLFGRTVTEVNGKKEADYQNLELTRDAAAAAKTYKPRNKAYAGFNKFSFRYDSTAATENATNQSRKPTGDFQCTYNLLLNKSLKNKSRRFAGYLQQICFVKDGDKYAFKKFETAKLSCAINPQFAADENDQNPEFTNLVTIMEKAGVANGDASVNRYTPALFTPFKAKLELSRSLTGDKDCGYETIENDDEKILKSLASDEGAMDPDVASDVRNLVEKKKVRALVARVLTHASDKHPWSCPLYYYRAYLKSGYVLELNYSLGD